MRQFAIAHFQRITVEPVNTTHDSEYFTLSELVLMWHLAGLDIEPLLTLWEKAAPAPKNVIDFANLHMYSIADGKYCDACASKDFAIHFAAWATAPQTIALFQDKAYQTLDALKDLNDYDVFAYNYLTAFLISDVS